VNKSSVTILFTVIAVMWGATTGLAQEENTRILSQTSRSKILKHARIYSKPIAGEKNFDNVRIPFVYVEGNAGEEAVSLEDITDADILRYIAKVRKPNGRVKRRDKYYLIFSFGVRKAGDTITAPYGGNIHEVLIEEVNQQFYKLRFNEETITIPFSKVDKKRLRKDT
tara:strand:+ start:67737 stop:68240 length:504 start_codon:yes stop_codon:yes gene_type:complete